LIKNLKYEIAGNYWLVWVVTEFRCTCGVVYMGIARLLPIPYLRSLKDITG
jgi:hypothetical protein